MRLRLLVLAVVAPIALWAVLPVLSSADDPSPGQIQKQINRKQSLIGGHKKHERVLTSDIEQPLEHRHFALSAEQALRLDVAVHESFSPHVRRREAVAVQMLHDVSRNVWSRPRFNQDTMSDVLGDVSPGDSAIAYVESLQFVRNSMSAPARPAAVLAR